ncbi:hypothetical protein [Microbacterium sp. Leaf159]|uniref:hypothetical protein n=1 Tax=Microbacterium sp. Leaf159 TaxID=1736279 RepID=UPI0006F2445A|nr:hypothetical protein [Microbacterium sp. Leaf159]KQR38295.1 hypothetical protein ASF80_01780 [Microbacterium sp. Leaf159]
MSPHFVSRLLASTAAIAVALVVSGCATIPGAVPVPTSTATATPTDPAPTTTPTPSAVPLTFGDFTGDQLAQICIDQTRSTFSPDVTFDTESTRIERRTVTPEWLVIVPARTGGMEGRSLCTIGGTPDSPVVEMASGSIDELPEEQIQRLIRGENEGTNP